MAKNPDGLTKAQREELPSTVERSDAHARATYGKTLDSARDSYGEGERARRTAMASLKHTHEKVGDHWERKDENGPSDEQAATDRSVDRPTAGGVDANASKAHLYGLAQRLDVQGRSSMSKDELVEALDKASRKATAEARED